MTEVVPAIIPHSFVDIQKDVRRVRKYTDFVQIDVSDGIFSPEKTWPHMGDDGEIQFEDLVSEKESLPFWKDVNYEVHLMVQEPMNVLDKWISTGVARIILHVESDGNLDEMISLIRNRSGSDGSLLRTEIGLALLPSTELGELDAYLDKIDFVQFMGNDKIGYHGVELDPHVYDKIKELRKKNSDIGIAVDIGVDEDTAPKLVSAGCTKLVSGSALFDAEDIKAQIEAFKEL